MDVWIKMYLAYIALSQQTAYLLSRLVAFVHLLYVLFVVFGLFFILLGAVINISLTRNIYFRVIHLLAMVIVAIQQYYMINCPLTVLEKRLLMLADKPTYSGAFIPHLLKVVNMNIPTEMYLPLYITLSVIFLMTFILVPPKITHKRKLVKQ